jgi:Phage tail tube protein
MAIAAYPATIKVGGVTINDITTYDVPMKMDMVETTAFSGSGGATVGTKTYVPTLFGAVVKASGSWNKTDTGQAALESAFFARTSVSMVFSPNGTNTYSCSAFISGYNPKGDTKGVVTIDFELTISGAVTPA